jgi:hypothetical protein
VSALAGLVTPTGLVPMLAAGLGPGTFIEGTLGQVALPDLTALRRSLLGWLGTADAAGLDEDGTVALFTSALRDFRDRRGSGGPAGGEPRGGAPRRAVPRGEGRRGGTAAGVA